MAPDVDQLEATRRELRGWLGRLGLPDDLVEELVLVANELCANAVEASPPGDSVAVEVDADTRTVVIAVSNARAGDGREILVPRLRRGSLQSRGRGLAIVEALADDIDIRRVGRRTVVRARRSL